MKMIVKIVSKKQREHKEIEPTVIRLPANQYEIDDAFLRAKIKKGTAIRFTDLIIVHPF